MKLDYVVFTSLLAATLALGGQPRHPLLQQPAMVSPQHFDEVFLVDVGRVRRATNAATIELNFRLQPFISRTIDAQGSDARRVAALAVAPLSVNDDRGRTYRSALSTLKVNLHDLRVTYVLSPNIPDDVRTLVFTFAPVTFNGSAGSTPSTFEQGAVFRLTLK